MISAEGIRPNKEKVEKLLNMKRPINLKELRSVMGLRTYFTTFMPGYSITASPLLRQLKKENKELVWDEECDKAWNEMKKNLASAPVIGYPKYDQPFSLHTDACQNGYAAILVQEQHGHPVIIDAISRITNDSEKKYSAVKQERMCDLGC